jgi:hypothetical protein
MGSEGQAPAIRHRRRNVLAAAALIAAATLLPADVAHANQMAVFSCHDPAGNPVGHAGWTIERTAQMYMTAADSCGAGGAGSLSLELGANSAGYPNGAEIQWRFWAPSWASIAKYTIQVPDSYARPGSTGVGQGQVFVDASDESDPVYDYRNLGGGSWGQSTIERSPPAPVSWVTVNASCDGQEGSCPTGVQISRVDVSAASVLLNDFATPTVSEKSGSLLSGSTLRGQAEASFQAQEEGPGIYSAWLTVDGKARPAVLLNSNNGLCVDLGQTSDGTRSFSSPTPCAKATSGSLTINTAELTDGTHTLKLQVDDAAGNTSTAFDGTIVTDNAPEDGSPPAITGGGQAQVGTALGSQPGEWSAPEGAGSISYAYQWQSCDSKGEGCRPIAGAESASYTPSPADAGHTLRVAVTAADSDGHTTVSSAPSATVAAPAGSLGAQPGPGAGSTRPTSPPAGGGGPSPTRASSSSSASTPNVKAVIRLGVRRRITRSFKHRALRLRGRLLDTHDHPIAHAKLSVLQRVGHGRWQVVGHVSSGGKGRFVAHIRPGPSRQIEVAYQDAGRHGYAATAKLLERVRAGVRLHIRPLRTSRTGTIVLTGRVLGHIPRHGVNVDLLVHYRGKWVPFRTPHTNRRGRFKVAYRFQGARGRFPFRAQVPGGQAQFPYSRGASEVIYVSTR